MSKTRQKYQCSHCGSWFPNMTEHMTHFVQTHDTGYKPRGERALRPVTCWMCAKDMVPPPVGTEGWFHCECGFELPKSEAWVDGQLVRKADVDDN